MAPVAMREMEAPASVASVRSLRSGGQTGCGRGIVLRIHAELCTSRDHTLRLSPCMPSIEWPITLLHQARGYLGIFL
jgi:hypothetical protein